MVGMVSLKKRGDQKNGRYLPKIKTHHYKTEGTDTEWMSDSALERYPPTTLANFLEHFTYRRRYPYGDLLDLRSSRPLVKKLPFSRRDNMIRAFHCCKRSTTNFLISTMEME
jgi:hypothetical protein